MKTMNEKSEVPWALRVAAAKSALKNAGYTMNRIPGRGRSNRWELTKDGATISAAIRTTKGNRFAFPPQKGGTRWKTLDSVDWVVVAAPDNPSNPEQIEVYMFEAQEVRKHFDAAYRARKKAGHVMHDSFGMWVGLREENRDDVRAIGSGLADHHRPIGVFRLDELGGGKRTTAEPEEEQSAHSARGLGTVDTIAEVMKQARERIAELSGVRPESVKLDLKIEY